jgi:hypothetical protein
LETKWNTEASLKYANIQLLFLEPVGITQVFSEQEGEWHELVPEGSHSYHKINSKGRENCYYYENGQLKLAEIDGGLIRFSIELK